MDSFTLYNMRKKSTGLQTFIVLAFVMFLTVSMQQHFVSQECSEAEYIRKQMVSYGESYNVFPMDIAKIVKWSFANECPVEDMYHNNIINLKQMRVTKLMIAWIKLDYACRNKKRI